MLLTALTAAVICYLHLTAAVPLPASPAAVSEYPISLSRADADALADLPAIGDVLAEAIIEYRKKHPIQKVEDLLNVPGIGEKRLEALRPYVTV